MAVKLSDLLNKPLFAKVQTRANLRSEPSTASRVVTQVARGDSVGVMRAWIQRSDGIWFRVEGVADAWVRSDIVTNVPVKPVGNVTNDMGNSLVQKLIANDLKLFHRLLVMADQITGLELKGVDTGVFEMQFSRINREYSGRQEKIKNSKLVSFQLKVAKGFEELKNQFSTRGPVDTFNLLFPKIFGLPLVPLAIGGVVGLATGVTLYFVFKPDFDASERNLVESKQLKALLDKASPEVAEKIRKDLEAQIDAANRAGITKGTFGTFFNIGKFLLPVGLTLLAIKFLPQLSKNK